jgi:hypothetical protein
VRVTVLQAALDAGTSVQAVAPRADICCPGHLEGAALGELQEYPIGQGEQKLWPTSEYYAELHATLSAA